ncbi:hypothetical protein V1509DRAFT_675345 [Lipomyces kononenkoae]
MTVATEFTSTTSNSDISSSSSSASQDSTPLGSSYRVATGRYPQVATTTPKQQLSINSSASTSTGDLSSQTNLTSSVNSKKSAVTTAAVPPALPILSPSIAQGPAGPTHFAGAPPNISGQGHVRKKSIVNQSSAVPGPRRTWSLNNAVHFSGQQNQPALATNGSAPIQFGSINATGGSFGVPGPTNPQAANLGSLNSSQNGQPISNSASPVPPHAVISGGIPRFQAAPNGAVKFGTVETTDRRDHQHSSWHGHTAHISMGFYSSFQIRMHRGKGRVKQVYIIVWSQREIPFWDVRWDQ